MRVVVERHALDHVLQLAQWALYGFTVFAVSYAIFVIGDRLVFRR